MKYIEGIDYWVRCVKFPNMASESVVASHGDGTFTVYINTLFSPERQRERLEHELKHLEEEHFYRDDLTIQQIERQADRANIPAPRKSLPRVLPGPEPKFSVFRSADMPAWASFAFYMPGKSAQPVIKNGELVYCDDKPVSPGDIGLFQFDGDTFLRQYNQNPFGIYLLSLNRKQARDDIFVSSTCNKSLICLGRIVTKEPVLLPHLR